MILIKSNMVPEIEWILQSVEYLHIITPVLEKLCTTLMGGAVCEMIGLFVDKTQDVSNTLYPNNISHYNNPTVFKISFTHLWILNDGFSL